MIAGYTLLCMLIILCMTTFFYNEFRHELRGEIFQNQEERLKRVSNTVAFRAEYVNYLIRRAQQDKEISTLFFPAKDANTEMNALRSLIQMRASVKQLHSIYIYNEYEGAIYCSAEENLPLVSNKERFEDQGFVEMLGNIKDYSKFTPFLRRISAETPNGQQYETYVYTYLIYDTYNSGSRKNIVAFNFHLGWIDEALNFIAIEESKDEKMWIVDENRRIIYSSTGDLIGTVADEEELPEQIYERESGYLIPEDGKQQQMLVYATPTQSGYENWTFVSWRDYTETMAPMKRVQTVIYIVCILALLVSGVIIILLSRYLYAPVRKTIDKMDELEIENQKKKKMDRTLFLRKLFLGNEVDDIEKIKEKMDCHHIHYPLNTDHKVILISVDYLSSILRVYGKELERIDDVIETLIQSKFENAFGDILCVKMQEGIWAVSIPALEIKSENTIEKLFEESNTELDQTLQISISMAISETGYSVRDIPYLYSEAMDIYSYRYLLGQNRMITHEEISEHGEKRFVYPHELEKKVLSNLFAGKPELALDSYEEFVTEITTFSVEEIKLSFMLLAYAIKDASRNTTVEASSILIEFDQFYKKLQALETIDEVNQMFFHLIGEIVEKMQAYALERHEVLINQIKQYVAENYGHISLSMNEVSDSVDMSAAYLGRLFKQVAGLTFTEYLTKYRLAKACELLTSTDMTVNEISDEVGFTNSSYFYIVFKKNIECTPSQYRRKGEVEKE